MLYCQYRVFGIVAGERLLSSRKDALKAAVKMAKEHGGQGVQVLEDCHGPVFGCGWKRKSKRSKKRVLRCKAHDRKGAR